MFKVGRRPCLGSGTQCAYKRYHLPGTWSVPRYLITSQVPEHHHSRCNGFRHGRHHQSHHHHRHHEGNLCHLFLGNSIGGRRGFSRHRRNGEMNIIHWIMIKVFLLLWCCFLILAKKFWLLLMLIIEWRSRCFVGDFHRSPGDRVWKHREFYIQSRPTGALLNSGKKKNGRDIQFR